MIERESAEAALDVWKEGVLQPHKDAVARWEETVSKIWEKWYLKNPSFKTTTNKISNYFRVCVQQVRFFLQYYLFDVRGRTKQKENAVAVAPPELPPRPKPSNLPIATDMAKNVADSFAGYGRHTINDFLFQLAIHPHTPSYIICQDDTIYNEFKAHLHVYMKQYRQPKFLDIAATVTNNSNPFAFNQKSDEAYTAGWVQVFRRTKIFVPKALYNRYALCGLLDENHTIGLSVLFYIFIS